MVPSWAPFSAAEKVSVSKALLECIKGCPAGYLGRVVESLAGKTPHFWRKMDDTKLDFRWEVLRGGRIFLGFMCNVFVFLAGSIFRLLRVIRVSLAKIKQAQLTQISLILVSYSRQFECIIVTIEFQGEMSPVWIWPCFLTWGVVCRLARRYEDHEEKSWSVIKIFG